MSTEGTFSNARLPPEMQARVEAELAKGERLLWVGQPRPRRMMTMSLPMFLFGIPWTLFAIFWVVMASSMMGGFGHDGPGNIVGILACFPLFGVPFIIIGIVMLTSPLWMQRRALNTFYAVTDRRAILWNAGWFGGVTVRSFPPKDLTRMRRTEFADGSGDLIFDEYMTWRPGTMDDGFNQGYAYGRRGYWQRNFTGFFGIERVKAVEDIIRGVLLTEEKPGGEK
jgi:hypothetical protein